MTNKAFSRRKHSRTHFEKKRNFGQKMNPENSQNLTSKQPTKTCQGKSQKTIKFATFAKFWSGTRGLGKEPLNLICRKNRRRKGKMPAQTGKSQKIPVWWFAILKWVGEKCRDFLIICAAQGKKTTVWKC